MKTQKILIVAIAVFCSTLSASVDSGLPSTNQVAKYERRDSEWTWREVSRSDGDAVLICLRGISTFKTWSSTVPPDIRAIPIRTGQGFRIVNTSGGTNLVHFSSRGQLVNYAGELLIVPDKEEKTLSDFLAKWRETDNKRIALRPLPCQYCIGTANDGSTLSGIALLFYADAAKWREIYEANKGIIKNPDIINGGTVITIPKLKETSNHAAQGTAPKVAAPGR